jgi:hypothetical protein
LIIKRKKKIQKHSVVYLLVSTDTDEKTNDERILALYFPQVPGTALCRPLLVDGWFGGGARQQNVLSTDGAKGTAASRNVLA